MAAPESPDRLARYIEHALRVGGLSIALVQGVYLPLVGGSAAISPPILAVAVLMMGLGQAIRIDRRRQGGDDE